MPSKKPLYYKQLYLLIFRNVGWIGILSFLVLFFAIPMHLVLLDKKEYREWGNNIVFQQILDINSVIQMGVLLLTPILIGIFLFRYIQNKAFSDLMHSLPVSRKFLFHFFTWNGFVVLVLPVVLNGLILMAAYSIFDLGIFISIKSIWSWIGIFTVYTSVIYFACIFVGMLTGLSITQGLFTALFLLFPAGVIFMLFYNFSTYVYGFPLEKYISDKLIYLSPILAPAIIYSNYSDLKVCIAYIVVSVIFYVAAMLLYKRRNAETVYQTLTFRNLRGLFKYTVTICFMLLAGLYFQVMNNGIGFHLFGLLIGSLIGYLIGEMFIQKSWRVFNRLKGYAYFFIAVVIVAGVSPFLINKYEQYIPEENDIKSIAINDSMTYTDEAMKKLSSSENMEKVIEMQRELIKTQNTVEIYGESVIPLTIEYKLNNNKKVTRTYTINQDDYSKWLKPIYESKEYKQQVYDFESQTNITEVTLEFSYEGGAITITNPEELKGFLSALTADKQKESYEDMKTRYISSASISILKENDENNYNYYDSFITLKDKQTIAWLKKHGYHNELTIKPEFVEKVVVFKARDLGIDINRDYDYVPENIEEELDKLSNKVEVNTESLQKEIISTYSYGKEKYAVYVKTRDQYGLEVNYITEENLPESIKNSLEK